MNIDEMTETNMSDTPRTDAILPLGSARDNDIPHYVIELAGLCRSLERELSTRRILDRESALIAKVRELEKDKAGLVVERDALWCLLDDIDTAEDIFKPMINNHFRYVNKKHRKRFNVCDMTDDRHDKAREFLKQHGGEEEASNMAKAWNHLQQLEGESNGLSKV